MSNNKRKKLFIVESPTKIKTLQKILNSNGEDFLFIATLGHIKDLPVKSLGVDLSTFDPKFELLKGKEKILKNLTKLLTSVEEIYLATDPDREGEAISVHLFEYLNAKIKKVSNLIFKRVELYEITPLGLHTALNKARTLDYNLYQSWKARRVLDRLIGYLVSPKLSQYFKLPLSAGRVQSPALKLIVEREREIENFKPKKNYSLIIYVTSKEKRQYELELYRKNQLLKTQNKEDLLNFYKKYLEGKEIILEKIKEKNIKKYPPYPLKTSTLIEVSGKWLGLTPKETMKIAQNLYEKGLITYMRTDSVRVSPLAKKSARTYIEKIFGKEYLGEERKIKHKGIIQDAHECIRPTEVLISMSQLGLRGLEKTLYELIFSHFIASQMKSALFKEKIYQFRNKEMPKGDYLYLKEKILLFDGFLKLLGAPSGENLNYFFSEGDILKIEGYKIREHESLPPERYTPHSLIKKLEELGIGRPSTYPAILDILLKRNYVTFEKKYLKPTTLGKSVCEYLCKNIELFMEYNFTAEMERALDEICEGKIDYFSFLKHNYELLKGYLSK